MDGARLLGLLEADGRQRRSTKGSHHVFSPPTRQGHVIVPHPKKDLGAGLVHAILKRAGLK